MELFASALFTALIIVGAYRIGVFNSVIGTGLLMAIVFCVLLPFTPNSELLTCDFAGRAALTVLWAMVTGGYRLALGGFPPVRWAAIWGFMGLRVGLAYQWGDATC